jgi:hypothetical protein
MPAHSQIMLLPASALKVIGALRVGHAGRDDARELEVPRDLAGRSLQHRLFAAAAGERAGAQVRDEGPCPEIDGAARIDQVDQGHDGERLGGALRERARERGGRRRPRLGRGAGRYRQAPARRLAQHRGRIRSESQRRYDRAHADRGERLPPEGALRTEQQVPQPLDLANRGGFGQ